MFPVPNPYFMLNHSNICNQNSYLPYTPSPMNYYCPPFNFSCINLAWNFNNLVPNPPTEQPPLPNNEKSLFWTKKEDFLLCHIIKTKNTPASIHENKLKWTKLAADLNVFLPENSQKTAKQCRERWINHLNPRMNKGSWKFEEDFKLIKNFVKYGKKWCLIAKEIPNRSQHSIKNRFYHLIAKFLNLTNRDAIKSKKNFHAEAAELLKKMQLQNKEKTQNLSNANQVIIKKEENSNRNTGFHCLLSQQNNIMPNIFSQPPHLSFPPFMLNNRIYPN